jgi:hypothetical protein
MDATSSSETSVNFRRNTWSYIPENITLRFLVYLTMLFRVRIHIYSFFSFSVATMVMVTTCEVGKTLAPRNVGFWNIVCYTPSTIGKRVRHHQLLSKTVMCSIIKYTRFYFQHTSGIHTPMGNLNILTPNFSSVRLPVQGTCMHDVPGFIEEMDYRTDIRKIWNLYYGNRSVQWEGCGMAIRILFPVGGRDFSLRSRLQIL